MVEGLGIDMQTQLRRLVCLKCGSLVRRVEIICCPRAYQGSGGHDRGRRLGNLAVGAPRCPAVHVFLGNVLLVGILNTRVILGQYEGAVVPLCVGVAYCKPP